MASTDTGFSVATMNCHLNNTENNIQENKHALNDSSSDTDILSGAKLSDITVFTDRFRSEVKVVPVMVEFRRLIQCGDGADVVPGVRFWGYSQT